MCGIVGILGRHEVAPIIVDALKRLEYRGYDSAGIATIHQGTLARRRAVGKLSELSDLLVREPIRGLSGIGHTRWATHGAPTIENAHPHRAGRVAVVHNGIIENFRTLREELAADGIQPVTETDTETIALFTEREMTRGADPVEAVRRTLSRLEGAFALCFLFEGEEDLMIAARKGSPLAIGHGDGEMFVGSDALALAPMTRRVSYLEEGDWAVLTRDGVTIRDADGNLVERPIMTVERGNAFASKGNYRHFMAKEIHEQPMTVASAFEHYVAPDGKSVLPERMALDLTNVTRIAMVACGTAYYACLVAKYWLESLAGIPVDIDVASEFRYREPPVPDGTLAIFVSQSGETADTLAALRYMKGKATSIVSLVNVTESTIARESDITLPILAGPEIGVASTKAFTCQLVVLAQLALFAARQRGAITPGREAELLAALARLPGAMAQTLTTEDEIIRHSHDLAKARDILFIGRGIMFPLALEGALKLKEISYIHAEGYASGELKHGPIALIDETVPVIVMAPHDALFDKTVSNMQEVMARGGKVLLISDAPGLRLASEGVWKTIRMPEVDPFIAPILYALPAQLLAYHTAVTKGTDVDQPRNLAKSVTVE